MKKYTSTLALTGFFAALCAWFFLYEQRVRPENEKAEEKSKQVTSLNLEKIGEVEIRRLSNGAPQIIKFKKVDKDWLITSPVEAKADDGFMNAILSAITTTRQERTVDENPKDLELYGLKSPAVYLSAKEGSDGKPQEIAIGNDTPVGNGVYLQMLPSQAVYKVPKSIKTTLDKEPSEVRDKTLLGYSRFDISEAEIKGPHGATVFKKGDNNKWSIANHDFPAETAEWDATLGAILESRAVSFPAEAPKDYSPFGLKSPLLRISLTHSKDGKATRPELHVGTAKGKFYAKRGDSPIVYEIDNKIAEKANRPWTAFRSLTLANFDRLGIMRIRLERGKDTLELFKEDREWIFPTELGVKLDNSKVDQLLAAIQDSKVSDYQPAKAAGSAAESALVIKLFDKKEMKENEAVTLFFGKPAGKTVSGRRTGLAYSFKVAEEDFKKFNLQRGDFLAAAAAPKQ